MLTLPEMKTMTFHNFQTREEEAGRELLTTSITERQDKFGGIHKDKTITRVKISMNDIQTLREAFSAAWDAVARLPHDRRRALRRRVHGELEVQRIPRHSRANL